MKRSKTMDILSTRLSSRVIPQKEEKQVLQLRSSRSKSNLQMRKQDAPILDVRLKLSLVRS